MAVLNVHERTLGAAPEEVGALLDGLGGADDRLWPPGWPPMRFEGPLAVGVCGGHGPVRYVVSHYVPGHWVRFRFTGPRGFEGFHEFAVEPPDERSDAADRSATRTVLRHTLVLRPRGVRWLGRRLFFRPLHDAVFRHALDCAERALTGRAARPVTWSPYVRLLRAVTVRVAPGLAGGVAPVADTGPKE
ncbi:SRPBCC family protein [Streptomyces sp. HMX87]|uniref:SRPBCC family protein n=1 Tax=Streptomyces sp. HMX87 TaxID=3390849 RepID=UPI003A8B40A1